MYYNIPGYGRLSPRELGNVAHGKVSYMTKDHPELSEKVQGYSFAALEALDRGATEEAKAYYSSVLGAIDAAHKDPNNAYNYDAADRSELGSYYGYYGY